MTGNNSQKSMVTIFVLAAREFRKNISSLFSYEILFKVISLVVLGPIAVLVGAYFISFTGHSSVTNERLVAYFISLPGIASVLLWGVSNLSILLLDFAGLITIAYSSLRGRSVSGRTALQQAFRHMGGIIGISGVQSLAYALVSLPFLVGLAATYFALLTDYDISYYLAHRPPAFWSALFIGLLLAFGLLVVWVYLIVSWLFCVPVHLFERKILFEALSRSRGLIKGSFGRISAIVVVSLAVFFALMAIGTSIVSGLAYLLGGGIATLFNRPLVFAVIVLAVNYGVTGFISIIAFPFLGTLIARLYYERHQEQSLVPPDPTFDSEVERPRMSTGGKLAKCVPWLLVATVCVSIVIVAISVHDDSKMEDNVQVTAHRGSSKKAPENTLSAIRQAVDDGADFAEIDVQETADGVIVLLHDSDLMRVGGVDKKIWETTYKEMAAVDVGSWFSPRFAGERIPTLSEAIDVAKGRIGLNIELKYNGHDKQLAEKVVEIIEQKKFEEHCFVASLDYKGLRTVRRLNDRIRIGHIVAKAIGDMTSLDVDLISVESNLATAGLIRRARRRDMEVHVWTVNDAGKMEYFVDLRVDNVITDYPDLLVNILKKRAGMDYFDRVVRKLRSWLR